MNGWHFSYLFGNNIEKYVDKVRSFAHQEYNRPYYRIKSRIRYCVSHQIDIFERNFHFEKVSIGEYLDPKLVRCIEDLGLSGEYVLGPGEDTRYILQNWLFGLYYDHGIRNAVLRAYRAIKRLFGK